jgi:CheY-like chemotaxis protein
MPVSLVLAIGFDSLSLGIRNSLLQSAGYIVVSAFSLREAANLFLNGDFDVVLLDKSLPTKERDRMTSLIRLSGSYTPVVSIGSEENHNHFFVDATLDENPDSLLKGLKRVLAKVATSRKAYVSGVRNEREFTLGRRKKPSSLNENHQYLQQNAKAS